MIMDKLEQILDLIDHPERYSEAEVEAMLGDDECRKLYETLVDVDAALNSTGSRPDIEEEWTRWQQRNPRSPRSRKWPMMAASFVGLLVVSGIAFAAIHFARQADAPAPMAHQAEPTVALHPDTAMKDSIPTTVKKPAVHKTFENTTLERIIGEVADYYGVKPVFHHERAQELRLYYEWDSRKGLQSVVQDLNQFENITVTLEDGQLIVD